MQIPNGSLPLPAKLTVSPAVMVMSEAGEEIVESGAWLAAAFTVMVRCAGVGSARPSESVAVNETT